VPSASTFTFPISIRIGSNNKTVYSAALPTV